MFRAPKSRKVSLASVLGRVEPRKRVGMWPGWEQLQRLMASEMGRGGVGRPWLEFDVLCLIAGRWIHSAHGVRGCEQDVLVCGVARLRVPMRVPSCSSLSLFHCCFSFSHPLSSSLSLSCSPSHHVLILAIFTSNISRPTFPPPLLAGLLFEFVAKFDIVLFWLGLPCWTQAL